MPVEAVATERSLAHCLYKARWHWRCRTFTSDNEAPVILASAKSTANGVKENGEYLKTMLEIPASFDAADDLLWQASSGRLPQRGRLHIGRSGRIGPLVEMAMARWTAPEAYAGVSFESALVRMAELALSHGTISGSQVGDVAGVFPVRKHDPAAGYQVHWDQWAKHAENEAIRAGFPRQLIEGVLGALVELQDNVFEHSGRPETGLIAYAVSRGAFEFVVADAGIGVLESLRQNPEFSKLTDSGAALRAAVSDGASRRGRGSGHGYGIGQLFRALAHNEGELRFRSGDHALTLWGDSPSLTGQVEIAQKAWLQGLISSVRCRAPRRQGESG